MAKTAQITLKDPHTKKTAELGDPQAVRALLLTMAERLGEGDWHHGLSKDSSERVVQQILRKSKGLEVARDLIQNAESLEEIFTKTDLERDAAAVSKKGDIAPSQKPLPRGKDLELVQDDAADVIGELWEIFKQRVEVTDGDVAQTMTVRITWNPPTENRDGYIGTSGLMAIQGGKTTRTGIVKRGKGKQAAQLVLFAEPVDD